VLVDEVDAEPSAQLPPGLEVAPERPRPGRADQLDLGVSRAQGFGQLGEPLDEGSVDDVLVAQADHAQPEGLGVPGCRTHRTPAGVGRAVGVLDEVDHVLHVLRHPPGRDGLRSAGHILAAHPGRHDRHRRRTQLLAQQEVLVVADRHGLVVAPRAGQGQPLLARTDRRLPVVHVVQAEPVHEAPAGEPHERRPEPADGLDQVASEQLGPTARVEGAQLDQVEVDPPDRASTTSSMRAASGRRSIVPIRCHRRSESSVSSLAAETEPPTGRSPAVRRAPGSCVRAVNVRPNVAAGTGIPSAL